MLRTLAWGAGKTTAVVVLSGTIGLATPVAAQSSTLGVPAWTADVGVGILSEPRGDGAGPGFSISTARRIKQGPWSLSATVVGARISDVGFQGPNRPIVDRDWVIAMVGTSVPFIAGKFGVAMDLGAGPLWSRDRQVGTQGTLPPFSGPFGGWEAKAGMIVGAKATYRVAQSLQLVSRLSLVQQIFADNLLGASGGLVQFGVAYRR